MCRLERPAGSELSRRQFIGGTGAAIVAVGTTPLGSPTAQGAELAEQEETFAALRTRIRLTVNGLEHALYVFALPE